MCRHLGGTKTEERNSVTSSIASNTAVRVLLSKHICMKLLLQAMKCLCHLKVRYLRMNCFNSVENHCRRWAEICEGGGYTLPSLECPWESSYSEQCLQGNGRQLLSLGLTLKDSVMITFLFKFGKYITQMSFIVFEVSYVSHGEDST